MVSSCIITKAIQVFLSIGLWFIKLWWCCHFMIHSFCMDSFKEWSARRHFAFICMCANFVKTSSFNASIQMDSASTEAVSIEIRMIHTIVFTVCFFVVFVVVLQTSSIARFCRTVFCSQSITFFVCFVKCTNKNMTKTKPKGEKEERKKQRRRRVRNVRALKCFGKPTNVEIESSHLSRSCMQNDIVARIFVRLKCAYFIHDCLNISWCLQFLFFHLFQTELKISNASDVDIERKRNHRLYYKYMFTSLAIAHSCLGSL